MHLESNSREAFELVTDALEDVDQFRESRQISILDAAKKKLASAKAKDPEYFRAFYYDAIVDDLAGRSNEAISTFHRLEKENPPFANEVRYNHGVAEYHHYNHEALDRALALFQSVADDERSGAPLQLLAQAGLAQAHAMHMIPKVPTAPDLGQIESHFQAAKGAVAKTLQGLRRNRRWKFPLKKAALTSETAHEIEWTANNALGMALMYHTDYLPPPTEEGWKEARVANLRQAVKALEAAHLISRRNWANQCDMASARMRLAYYLQDSEIFDEATRLLQDVVADLRPQYGFALYEKGRVLRLRGRFEAAAKQFEEVLAMPADQRYDISERRLTLERDRARLKDQSFP